MDTEDQKSQKICCKGLTNVQAPSRIPRHKGHPAPRTHRRFCSTARHGFGKVGRASSQLPPGEQTSPASYVRGFDDERNKTNQNCTGHANVAGHGCRTDSVSG